jgi:hypothetical protein
MAAEPLLVIDEPALAVHRHHGNVGPAMKPAILKHLGAGEDVFADPRAFALAWPSSSSPRLQLGFLLGVESSPTSAPRCRSGWVKISSFSLFSSTS